jgi:hypothetical protein
MHFLEVPRTPGTVSQQCQASPPPSLLLVSRDTRVVPLAGVAPAIGLSMQSGATKPENCHVCSGSETARREGCAAPTNAEASAAS